MSVFPQIKRNLAFFPIIATIVLRLAAFPFVDFSKTALLEYGVIARNLLSGYGYSYTWFHTGGSAVVLPSAYMPPGQVLIDYGIMSVAGDTSLSISLLFLFQIFEACVFVYFTGKIAQSLFGSERTTRTTLWLAALYPSFIYVSTSFGVSSSALALNAIVLYLALRFSEALRVEKDRMRYALLFGCTCGVYFLFRGESPVIVFATLALIAYSNRATLRRSFLYVGISGLTSLAVLAPWTIRNYVVFDRLIPISTNGGLNFWRGNNEFSTGSSWNENGGPIWSSDEIWSELEPSLDAKGDFEKMSSEIHSRAAWKWIRDNPSAATVLAFKKALILWTIDIRSKLGGTVGYIALYFGTLLALVVGILAIRKDMRFRREATAGFGISLIGMWCVLTTVLAMIFFPLPRFQVFMVGVYFPIIGYGMSEFLRRYIPSRTP